MVIYGEYLFLENFITGLVILYFTGRIAGEELRPVRLAICGLCCGAYSFVLFIAAAGVLSALGKLVFAVSMVLIAFGKKSWKQVLSRAALFLLVTFLYGGIAIALLSAFRWEGISGTEGMYMPAATYLTVMFAATAAALILRLAVSLICERRHAERTSIETIVSMGRRQWKLQGFIDSGNMLREPLTRRPVAVVSRTLMEEILDEIEDTEVRYTVVPFKSIGAASGVMDGYRADYVRIPGRTIKKPVLAVCEDDAFLKTEEGEGQILLPASMLERGIYANID